MVNGSLEVVPKQTITAMVATLPSSVTILKKNQKFFDRNNSEPNVSKSVENNWNSNQMNEESTDDNAWNNDQELSENVSTNEEINNDQNEFVCKLCGFRANNSFNLLKHYLNASNHSSHEVFTSESISKNESNLMRNLSFICQICSLLYESTE